MSTHNNTTVVSVMDVGGTHATAARVDVETRTILNGQSFREPLDGEGSAAEILSALVRCASRLPAQSGSPWGIALPGPFDYALGIARYAGVGKFDALAGVDLRTALRPHLPGATRISFHNDADAFMIGEWLAGPACAHRSAVGITLGTGVGSSFLRDGHILQSGPGIPPDGRVDLLRYGGRPLEETVSRRAIRRAYAQATGQSQAPDVREITERARQGDRTATDVLTRAFRALGTVLGPYLAEFEPGVLVFGGAVAASWDLVALPLRSGLADADPRTAPIALEPRVTPRRLLCSARRIWLMKPIQIVPKRTVADVPCASPAAASRLRLPRGAKLSSLWRELDASPLGPDLARFVAAAREAGFTERVSSATASQIIARLLVQTGRPLMALTDADFEELIDACRTRQLRTGRGLKHYPGTIHSAWQVLFHLGVLDSAAPPLASPQPFVGRMSEVSPSLRDSFVAYLLAKSATCRPNTVSSLATRLAHFGRFLAETDPSLASLADLDRRRHIEPFLAALTQTPKSRPTSDLRGSRRHHRAQPSHPVPQPQPARRHRRAPHPHDARAHPRRPQQRDRTPPHRARSHRRQSTPPGGTPPPTRAPPHRHAHRVTAAQF